MKPEKQREDDEANCLSPIDEDASSLAPDGVDPKAVQDHELANGAADGSVAEDATSYEAGLDGVCSDSLIGSDGSDSAYALRRHRHNVKEKERKEKIKLDMQEIQNLLPPSQVTDKRQTMHELLQLGIQHLRYLTEQNNQLVSSGGGNINELERLRKENEELKLESSRYRGLIATAGLPVGVDPSQLMITWRYRTIEEINNPFLFAPSGQQMTTNILPAPSVENGQQAMAQGMAQQFNGQISYATGDPSTSQYMMYTDLLNSSDPSCMGLATNEPQNGFSSHGTSLVTHNGQLMLVSQPQVQMQTLPMTPCQSSQGVDHLGATDPQPSDYQTANSETTIDRKQLEESSDSPSLSGICQMNGVMECVGGNGAEVVASENSGSTDDTEAQATDGVGCPDTISIQDGVSASDQPQSVEVQSGNQQFFSGGAPAVQPTLIMNNTVIYRDGSGTASTAFDPNGEHGAVGMATSSSCSLVTTNPGADSQLQGNFGGQSVVLHNGQVLLVNQNQNMGPQPLGPPMNGQVIGQDFSGGFCQGANPQFSAANLSLQSAPNQASAVFLNKPNQFSSQSMTFFPGQSPALPPALLQPPLASNQTVTVNTPQGPMIMHTLPSKPNEHPQALILPDGQIVPVVTQPNLLFPPQQCIPVTGSLLVPSVTPSRMAPNVMQGTAQNALTAKLVDGKCQTFALPQSSSMQLGSMNLQPFSSIVSHVLSGVDSTKLYSTAPLQAVPAQGHLPLPTLQPCSSASKSSRSKKKQPVTATTAAKASNRPQSFTAMVMPEGNILLLPGGDVTQAPSTSSHTKPSQRPLMPKPMPKADGIVAQPLVTVSQSQPLIGGMPIATAQLAPGQVVGGGQQMNAPMMTPLTLSLPNQPILPFGCAQIPPVNVNSTDILAQATESLFTISPNNQNQTSDIFTKDIADDQLHIDIGSMAAVDSGAQAEGERPVEKLKKSKKKKNAKAKTVEEPSSGMVDQQNMQFNLFSPGAKHDEEKESDINDFADLIRMEPPTPAPAKGPETSDGIPPPVSEEAGTMDGAKSSAAVANGLPGASESCVESNISSESAHLVDIPTTTACGTNGDLALILSSKDAVPSESLNILPPAVLTAKNSDNPKASCTDINDKRKAEKTVADATGGRKTSPRKKKSNKANDNLQAEKNLLPEADKCSGDVTPSNSCHQLNNSEISDSTVETSLKASLRSSGNVTERLEKTAPARELEIARAPSSTAEQPFHALPNNSNSVKAEKPHANSREKRSSGRSSKKDKSRAEVSTEEENQNGVVSGSTIEPNLPEDTDSGNRRGFALSNFLPAARQPSIPPKAVDSTRSCKGHKKSRHIEDGNVNEPPGLETEAVQTTEEATQTVKKELRSRHRHNSESDGKGKKRQKKSPTEPAEQASEELPEMLNFAVSEIFDVIDKVENMAVATQTEPKRKSHGRKHKSNCERDGSSSSKRKKKSHDNTDSSVSVLEERRDAENSSTLADAKTKDCAVTTQSVHTAVTASEPKCIDVFSFEAGDCSGKIENQAISFKMASKKLEEANALDKDSKNPRDSDILKPRERSSPKPVLCSGVSQSSCTSASTVSKSKSKFSFFAPSTSSGMIGSTENKFKMSSSSSEVSKSGSSSMEILPPKTSLDVISGKLKSVESPVNAVASSVPEVSSCNSTSDAGSFQRSAELSAASTLSAASVWSSSPATQVPSSGAVDVPYSKASEVPMTSSTALSMSNILLSTSSSKMSAGKARHSNIVSLTGSLTPKSAVTKLTSHSQRSKAEREVPKDAANTTTREPEKNSKSTKNRENESQSATPVPNSTSTEAQQSATTKDAVAKDMVSTETVDSSRGLKPDKERTRQEREPISSSTERCANDSFVQDILPASNASHYMPPAPVLVQCAYNEAHQKSRTPSTVSSHSAPSAEAGITVPSSRSGFSQKSGGTQASSQNGMHSKLASSYNSVGGGLEMERKSWHEESRRRNEAEYYPSPMSSTVLSCAVQNKNSTPYSCSSAFPTDKIGMAHQQPEGGNFSSSFGGLGQNSFYSQPSSYRGLEQLSPCGGDNMSRGTMSSCSVEKHSSNPKAGTTSNDSSSIRRDMAKTNQHESYFTPQFLEPTVSPALNSMNRDKSSCLGTSMQSQTSSRQPVPHSSSTTGHSRSHTRSPSTADHQSSYPALSGYHGASGSLATSMLQHHLSPDYGRYSYNNQHSFGFDMFQTPGSQFNPNLAGLTFDPPPLNVFRDCSSVGMQSSSVKKSTSKLSESGAFETSKSMPTTSRTASSQQTSNQSQSCKSSSNRSASKSSSSASTKKSVKPSSSYGMESGMLDSRCVTPFIGLGSLSPSRTVPPESLSYFAPPNLFGNAGRALPSAKTLQHRDTPLPLNAALFSPSRAAQNGFGLNFQTGFAMDHVHGSHMGSSQVIAPPPSANAMPAHMHGFGFGNIFSDIGGAAQREHLSMSPIKLAGSMDTGTLHHHHHHQGAGSMYNGRGQLPAHMLSDMGFNPFLGPQHPGFDARGIGTPFGSLWT